MTLTELLKNVLNPYRATAICQSNNERYIFIDPDLQVQNGDFKVLRPSGPNNWKNVEWIPYVFSKEYCSECQT